MDNVLNQLANVVASKVARQLAPLLRNGKYHVARRRKLDMKCRVPRCMMRSRGPRYRYMCRTHEKELTKAQQLRALASYNESRTNGR